jgi:hypothetical protein
MKAATITKDGNNATDNVTAETSSLETMAAISLDTNCFNKLARRISQQQLVLNTLCWYVGSPFPIFRLTTILKWQ